MKANDPATVSEHIDRLQAALTPLINAAAPVASAAIDHAISQPLGIGIGSSGGIDSDTTGGTGGEGSVGAGMGGPRGGPFFLGGADPSLVDVHLAPWVLRSRSMLGPLRRGWTDPLPGTRWHAWTAALEAHPAVRATTSLPQLYVETLDIFTGERPLQRLMGL